MQRENPTDISRRLLMRGALGAAAALPLSSVAMPALAQRNVRRSLDSADGMIASLTDKVYINSNESPLGPCDGALQALDRLTKLSGRYGMSFASNLEKLYASQNGLKPENVVIHPGSYVPLRNAALAYSSEARPIAYYEPTFDSGFFENGQCVTRAIALPMAGDFRQDMKKLLAAAPNAGVYYVCNPNNPTGIVTPRADIEWLLANKPKGSVVLVDEAYIHFSESAVSCLDLVARGADILVLRTFSKIYGLAGLRIGLVAGRKDLLDGMARYGINVTPMTAAVAAEASLLDARLVPDRMAYTRAVRDDLYAFLKARGNRYLPSEGCFAMVHVGRPGEQVVAALAAEGVMISGPRKYMPDWVRVSFGTPQEMAAFKTAFAKVMA